MITHVKAAASYPFAPWVRVIDVETGEAMQRVIEANTAEGWFTRHMTDASGRFVTRGPRVVAERVERSIRLEISEDAPEWAKAAFNA